MTLIVKATANDCHILATIGKTTLIESHGNSAPEEDINSYVNENFTPKVFEKELRDEKNIYYLIYYNNQPVGYSKIILNTPNKNIDVDNVAMLERIYVLKEFYGLRLGYELLKFNMGLSKPNNQHGIWLNVWVENKKAINFYKKVGFKIIGSYEFRVSETHSNPNHQLFLKL